MSQLSHRLSNLEERGRLICNTNQTMRDFGEIIAHPMFREFFNRYFSSPGDVEASLTILGTGSRIQQVAPELTGNQIVALTIEMLADADSRSHICQAVQKRIRKFPQLDEKTIQCPPNGSTTT